MFTYSSKHRFEESFHSEVNVQSSINFYTIIQYKGYRGQAIDYQQYYIMFDVNPRGVAKEHLQPHTRTGVEEVAHIGQAPEYNRPGGHAARCKHPYTMQTYTQNVQCWQPLKGDVHYSAACQCRRRVTLGLRLRLEPLSSEDKSSASLSDFSPLSLLSLFFCSCSIRLTCHSSITSNTTQLMRLCAGCRMPCR